MKIDEIKKQLTQLERERDIALDNFHRKDQESRPFWDEYSRIKKECDNLSIKIEILREFERAAPVPVPWQSK